MYLGDPGGDEGVELGVHNTGHQGFVSFRMSSAEVLALPVACEGESDARQAGRVRPGPLSVGIEGARSGIVVGWVECNYGGFNPLDVMSVSEESYEEAAACGEKAVQ